MNFSGFLALCWESAIFSSEGSNGRDPFALSWQKWTKRLVPRQAPWKELPPTSQVGGQKGLLCNLIINSHEMYLLLFFFSGRPEEVGCCSEQR